MYPLAIINSTVHNIISIFQNHIFFAYYKLTFNTKYETSISEI